MSLSVVIKSVSKNFVLPHEKKSSVKSVFTGLLRSNSKSTKQVALNNINIKIEEGEFFGIVGRNGSGKSTLLKIIAGIYQPSKGEVIVNGKLVPFIELGVGFNPELTGRENVYLNGAILGHSTSKTDKNYDKIVEFAELEQYMDKKLKNYSSGMQVRLAFACATMTNMDVLIIDEVLAVGDADFQRKCFNYFKQLKRKGTTVIFVTHDMNAVREFCDRAVLIENSKIVIEGKPDKVATAYSRLFQGEDIESLKNEGERRGDGSMAFDSPTLKITEDMIAISTNVIVNRDVIDPVFGFSLKNAAGNALLGTNTAILHKKKLGSYKKGDKLSIDWSIPNVLNDGEHSIDLAVVKDDTITVYDWWDDALGFVIKKDMKTPYYVNPPTEFNLKKINKKKAK